MLGAFSCSCKFTTGTTYGPTAAGVKSITRMPCCCNTSLCLMCAPAEVASNTILISLKLGKANKPSKPSCVVGTPKSLARFKPSDLASMPTIAPMRKLVSLFFKIFFIKSVPILPEPMMAAAIFSIFFSISSRLGLNKCGAYRTQALNLCFVHTHFIHTHHRAQSTG